MHYQDYFRAALNDIHQEGRYRYFAPLERIAGDYPMAYLTSEEQRKKVAIWCSNDYLGLGQNPKVIEHMKKALNLYGARAGGTRNISGTSTLHRELEHQLAQAHDRDAALLFTSGYAANEATLSTLLRYMPGVVVFSDECNHASIIHGIRISGVQKEVFKHNNVYDLEQKLAKYDQKTPKIIVFESLYSMDGDFAPVSKICDLAEKYNCLTYVDEVHAVGIYGHSGMGYVEKIKKNHRIDILQANFGKAFGIIGGYITANSTLIDFIRSCAPPFIFTTALPPAIVSGIQKSLELIQNNTMMRNDLWSVVNYTKSCLQKAGFIFLDSNSHIIPLIVGDARLCKKVTDRLLEKHNIYVQPINYPTVPRGTERLRLTPNPTHTPEMVHALVEACLETWQFFTLPLQKKSA